MFKRRLLPERRRALMITWHPKPDITLAELAEITELALISHDRPSLDHVLLKMSKGAKRHFTLTAMDDSPTTGN